MAYIEKNYYTDNYHGTEMSDDDFAKLARAASLVIDVVTFGRAATATDAKSLSAVKTATATEVEYLYYQGGVDAINGKGDNLKTAEDTSPLTLEEIMLRTEGRTLDETAL